MLILTPSTCKSRSICYSLVMSISSQLRRAIQRSGESRYAIAQETGVNQSTLSRFVQGSGLSSENLDRVAEYLGLELKPKRKGGK
jgi:transcriptional regulator with XRE-family HTH domain